MRLMNFQQGAMFLCIFLFLMITVSADNTTPSGSSEIVVTVGSTILEIGDPLEVEGAVSDSIIGSYPGTAILILNKPMASKLDSYHMIQVNDDGTFSFSAPTDSTGTWVVSARYGTETSASVEVKVNPRATPKRTVVVLNSRGGPARAGDDLELTGYLRDKQGVGIADKSITYMVAIPPYGCSICSDDDSLLIWETYGEVVTDSAGHFSLGFIPYDQGQYRVKAYFTGDDVYQPSSSETRSVRVT